MNGYSAIMESISSSFTHENPSTVQATMKKIVYELNEVPRKLFDFYAEAFPNSSFAKLQKNGQLFETKTADIGHLSPWVTWPTMHRGVANFDHKISDLGQDLTEVNINFPSVFDLLAQKGTTIGVFGSLQSYPIPKILDNFKFYVPDTFAAGSECFPTNLSEYQEFNLSMARSSGRNVASGIAVKNAARFLLHARQLGLTLPTAKKLGMQLAVEQVNRDRIVRRRTSQYEIAFDLFFKQLNEHFPDASFFFSNHLASSMHRYWPSIFPEDYAEGKFEQSWLKRWENEIPHAVKVANYQLQKLINFCNKYNFELILSSSMGQAAVKTATPISTQVLITDVRALMSYLELNQDEWELRFAMAPQVIIKPKSKNVYTALKKLNDVSVNSKKLNYNINSSGDVRFDINLSDISRLEVIQDGVNINPRLLGLELVNLQDATSAYAYHIPEGILIRYTPNKKYSNTSADNNWVNSSALDFCPSLLSSFGVDRPSYMVGDSTLFN